jgi:hypothetical protein
MDDDMPLPGLRPLERLALWVLRRSKRTSLVICKPVGSPYIMYSLHRDDPVASAIARNVLAVSQSELPSSLLERLYHQPSYGEDE